MITEPTHIIDKTFLTTCSTFLTTIVRRGVPELFTHLLQLCTGYGLWGFPRLRLLKLLRMACISKKEASAKSVHIQKLDKWHCSVCARNAVVSQTLVSERQLHYMPFWFKQTEGLLVLEVHPRHAHAGCYFSIKIQNPEQLHEC